MSNWEYMKIGLKRSPSSPFSTVRERLTLPCQESWNGCRACELPWHLGSQKAYASSPVHQSIPRLHWDQTRERTTLIFSEFQWYSRVIQLMAYKLPQHYQPSTSWCWNFVLWYVYIYVLYMLCCVYDFACKRRIFPKERAASFGKR